MGQKIITYKKKLWTPQKRTMHKIENPQKESGLNDTMKLVLYIIGALICIAGIVLIELL